MQVPRRREGVLRELTWEAARKREFMRRINISSTERWGLVTRANAPRLMAIAERGAPFLLRSSAIDQLLRPLPGIDRNAPRRTPTRGVAMRGEYELTYDLTGFTLPTVDAGEGTGFVVRTKLYVVSASIATLRDASHNPCPDATAVNRSGMACLYRPPEVVIDGSGASQTLTVPTVLRVAAIRGEVRCYSPVPQDENLGDWEEEVFQFREDDYGYVAYGHADW